MTEPSPPPQEPENGGVALPLARIVFNPVTVVLGFGLGLGLKAVVAVLRALPAALPGGAPGSATARVLERPFAIGVPALLAFAGLFAFLGLAIARVAAVRVCRGERLSVAAALAFAFRNWLSGALYPIALAVGVAGLLALAGILGLVAQIPFFGPIFLLPIYPLAFAIGVVAALLCGLGALAAPTVAGALAVERNGTLDALSRSFSYAFTRPAAFLFYGALVFLLGAAVERVGRLGLAATDRGLLFLLESDTLRSILAAAGGGAPIPDDPRFSATFSAVVLRGVRFALDSGVLGAALAIALAGGVAIYLTLRRDVDGVALPEMELAYSSASPR